jgi:predicted amidohydrolase
MRIFAALLSGSGPPPGPRGLGQARAQTGLLEGVLRTAHEEMVKAGFGKAGDQAVFVAPEFWFSNAWTSNDKFYNHDTKRWIVAALARMAKKYPNVLLIPGTVLWVKRKKNEGQVAKIVKRYESVISHHAKTFDALKTKDYGQAYDFNWLKKAQTNEPGWSHNVSQSSSSPSSGSPIDHLKNRDDILIGQNTAYVCKGDVVLKYHKVGNSAETQGFGRDIVFAPGSIAGQFLVGDVRYGLEICMDHWLGILAQSGAPKVDVQIVTSSTTATRNFHFHTNADAIFVHASNPPLNEGSAYWFGQTVKKSYVRLRNYADQLMLDLLIVEAPQHQDCSPGDVLKAAEPQQDSEMGGVLPGVKHIHSQLLR